MPAVARSGPTGTGSYLAAHRRRVAVSCAAVPARGRWAAARPSGRRARAVVVGASVTTSEPGADDVALNRWELQAAMEAAVLREDYEAAASLRDALQMAEEADPVISLRRQLLAAVEEERYEDASLLKGQLEEILPVFDWVCNADRCDKTPYSSTETNGIRVEAWSEYVPQHSCPDQDRWFFRYHMKIHNGSEEVVRIQSRSWCITDRFGGTERVKGPGVVGSQPVLSPGQAYEYSSACPLKTQFGSMQGQYEIGVWDQDSEDWMHTTVAAIGEFGLCGEAEDECDAE